MSESGYIIRCNGCCHYQLCFAGTILTLCEKEFLQFLKYIQTCYMPELDFDDKAVIISTPKQGVHLWVSSDDFSALKHLLETADCEIKALHLLALFK